MKTYELFNKKEMEELFLSLAHLDELEIRFYLIENKYYLYYTYKENWLFNQDKKDKYIFINYDKIWSVFEKKFSGNYRKISNMIGSMIKKHFKINGYTAIVDVEL